MKETQQSLGSKKIWLVAGLLLLFVVLGLLSLLPGSKTPVQGKKEPEKSSTKRGVLFEQPNLYIFDARQILNQFPDTIKMHYPYLLVVKPGDIKQTTTIYNLETKTKEKIFDRIALDYISGALLYTKGEATYFNSTNLGVRCDYGFIESKTEILCVTAKENDPLENHLVTINPRTLDTREVYASENLLGTIAVINGKLYVAEQNIQTKKKFITVDGVANEIPTQADIVYPMEGRVFYATFKASDANREAAYYEVREENGELIIKRIEQERIVLWK